MAKRGLLAGLGLVGLAAVAIVAAAFLIPEEAVGAAAARRAEAVLGQPVRVGGARVILFPHPGVRLRDVAVGGSDSSALAAVDRVDLTARLLPLLRGRVVVDRLALARPRLFLQLDSTGRPNLRLLARAADTTAATPAGTGGSVSFDVRDVRVDGGRLAFRDQRDGRVIRLDGWSQQLRLAGDIRGGELASVDFSGWIAFDDVDARLPGVLLPTRDLSLRLDHDATLDLAQDHLELRSASLTVNGVTLSGSGDVRDARSNTGRTGDLHFRAAGVDASELMAWIPDSARQRLVLPDGRPIRLAGTAALTVDIAGALTPDSLPALDARLELTDGEVRAGDDVLADGIRLTAALSRDSLAAAAHGAALGSPFTTSLAVRSPDEPVAEFTIDGGVDLARLKPFRLVPDTASLAGRVAADLSGAVPLRHRERSRVRGTIRMDELRATGLGPAAVAVSRAVARFDGDAVRIDSLPLEIGRDRSPLLVSARASNVLAGVLDRSGPPPRATVRIVADSLDLDAIFGAPQSTYPPLLFARLRDRPVDGRTAGQAAADEGLAVPALPRLAADARIDARKLVRNGLSYGDVSARVSLSSERLALDSVWARFMGGTLTGSGEIRPLRTDSTGAPVETLLAADYAMDAVGAAPFFDRLTPFRDHLTGSLALTGTLRMTLDRTALPLRESVQAGGTVALSGGRFTGWAPLDSIARRVGLPSLDTLRFREWAGSFGVSGTVVTLDETVLDAPGLAGRAAGAFDLSGALDLDATLFLPSETLARAGNLGRQAALLADAEGRIPVGIRITGTAAAPKVALDFSSAADAATARAKAAAEQEAGALARRAAAAAASRLGAPDSVGGMVLDSLGRPAVDSAAAAVADSLAQRADSLRAAAQEAIRKRLRKLLPGGGR